MMKILKNFFAPYKQILNRSKEIAFQVEDLESKYSSMTDEQMKQITDDYIKQLENKEITTDDIMVDAFAIVREMAYRVHNMKAYHVQLVGAAVVHYGDFAEMATGEGKTLTLLFPIFLNALEKKGVHVVSVNEYLVERDAHFCRLVLEKLGLTVGFNLASHPNFIKRGMYACDVTYTTNSELGFDYLRDNMVTKIEDKVQRSLSFAIVDEGDSILIDEARTPLIISGGQEKDSSVYTDADKCVKAMDESCYIIDRETQTISLTPEGVDFAQRFLNIINLFDVNNSEMVLRINNSLMANYVFMNGVQYIVREGKVLLVDQSTGRIMEGRAYSNGLNQAIQAKEMIEIEPENATVATITYQSFFRLYKKLAAVSGTAVTEAEEFLKIYNMIVAKIPTNRPVIRNDLPNSFYSRKKFKWNAVLQEIKQKFVIGQPVLVGTSSVEDSELLSGLLEKEGILHEILNAKSNSREAEIVSKAGQMKSITISTNMAGRGTDIKLGEGVKELGGLYVIGTNLHDSRRIDNQLRGRSGRQGDPGVSKFIISAQDELFFRYGLQKKMDEIFKDEDEAPLESKLWTRIFNSAQKKVENLHFDSRKNLMEYDQVLAKQRELVYKQRDKLMAINSNIEIFNSAAHKVSSDLIALFQDTETGSLKIKELADAINYKLLAKESVSVNDLQNKSFEEIHAFIFSIICSSFNTNNPGVPDEVLSKVVRDVFLAVIDNFWQKHIDQMLKLREGVQLRSLEQTNPLNIYINDGDKLFSNMNKNIRHQAIISLMRVKIQVQKEQNEIIEEQKEAHELIEKSIDAAEVTIEEEFKDEKQIGLKPNESPE